MSMLEVKSDSGFGRDTKVMLDGQPLGNARAVTVTASVMELNTATIELINLGLDVSLPATVSVAIIAYPGHDIVREEQPDGTVRWRSVDTAK